MAADEPTGVEELQAEVRRLRRMLECAPDFVARITPAGDFLYMNHLAPGFVMADVLGANFRRFLPEAFHERAAAAVRAAIETRTVQEYATVGPVSSNSAGHYLTRVSPIIEDGEVSSLVMIATNVTMLEEQRLLLQLALDSTGLGTFNYSPATGDGTWDETTRRMFELPAGAPVPTPQQFIAKHLHPEDREVVTQAVEGALAGGRFGPIEYRILLASGGTRWVSAEGTVLRDPSGVANAIVGTLKDVTERRALEARLRDAEKLESIGRLAGGVAHDFNNMLTAILGNVAFAAGLDTLDEARPLLDEIRIAAERSAALTAQLLAFARRQIIEPKVLAPAELIRRLEPLLRRLLDERKKLELSLPARGSVCVGESQLEQVVMNLVTNARDALPAGGRVRIETRDVSLDAPTGDEPELAPGEYVMIAVSDDGCGIAPEALPHLFEPFFTTRERGTGLGLATCYGIVKQSGGTISVESKQGTGSTFRVYLPAVSSAADRVDAAGMAPDVRRPLEKVLVVEDEENVRRVLERSLRRGEFAVYVAGDAMEALRIAEQDGPFDVLVTDVIMPEIDGPELALRLRERWPQLRVLFVSGYTHELPLKDANDAATEFLPKPFRPADVLNAVRRLCGSN